MIMPYAVKEIFYTLQGEGCNAGRAAVFCRFAGCNLWSGREFDRAIATCQFCDAGFVGTDGVGGGKVDDCEQVAAAIERTWHGQMDWHGSVVLTGAEQRRQL